jgi:polar amino acid transport system substrate-binding protein
LLVPKQSSVARVPDADQAGVRIAAVRNHASTAALSEILKHRELVLAEIPDQAFELLRSGNADVMASTRNALIEYSAQLPESRVLDDFYGNNLNRVVVPKGNAGRLAYVGDFIEEAKSSGMIQQAIDRAGPPGIKVAPPGDPK